MLHSVGVVHGEWGPVDVLHVHIEGEQIFLRIAARLLDELLEFLSIGVVENPLPLEIELERFVCLVDLGNTSLQLFHVGGELFRGKDARHVEQGLGWEVRAVAEGRLVGLLVPVHCDRGRPCSLLVREVVLVLDAVVEEPLGADWVPR